MSSVSAVAIILFAWLRFRERLGRSPAHLLRSVRPAPALAYAGAALLAPLFAAQAAILVLQTRYEGAALPRGSREVLPIPVFDGRLHPPPIEALYSHVALGVGVLETLCLGIVVLAAHAGVGRRLTPLVVAVGGALAAIALLTPAMATRDPYEYAATSMLGFAAYAPPAGAFHGTPYAPIFGRVPLRGVIYGPLWVAFDTLELALVPAIAAKIIVLRAVNAGLVAALLLLLGRAGASRASLVSIGVNPAVWCYAVLSPHADIEALVLLAAAMLAAQRARPWIAMVLLAAAGAVKLTFLLAGAAVLAPIAGATRRFGLWGGAIASAAVASLLVPGNAYVHDLISYVPYSRNLVPESSGGLWMVPAALAALATIVLLASGRGIAAAAWLFGQLAPLTAPWYLLWGFPYAQATGVLTALAVSLPLATVALDLNFHLNPIPTAVALGCAAGFAIEVVRGYSRTNAAIVPREPA